MKHKIKSNQRGSALLLTLGILSLVLILAMSFAFTARTNRQVAKVNADQIKAKLLAESGLERIMAAMKFNYDGTETGDIYPPGKNTGKRLLKEQVANSKYFAHHSGNVDEEYSITSQDQRDLPILNFTLSEKIAWKSVSVNDGANDEVIGRIAFIIVEEADKLDINQMLSLSPRIPFVIDDEQRLAPFTSPESAIDPGNFFYDIVGDGTYDTLPGNQNTYEDQTVRLGLLMPELRADNEYYKRLPQGYTGTKTRWFSYSHLWSSLWNTSWKSPISDDNEAYKYTFFSGEDVEAYWDGTKELQRFDVTGYEWRTPTAGSVYIVDSGNPGHYLFDPKKSGWHHDGTLSGARDLVDQLLDSNNVVDTSDFSSNTSAIEYLNTMSYPEQVAANMIDFCDEDSFATTDFDLAIAPTSPPSMQPPSYFGNEKVAYFNEIKVDVIGYRTRVDNFPNPDRFEPRLTLRPTIELVNIFEEDVPAGYCFVRVFGSYTIIDGVESKHLFGDNEEGYVDIALGNLGNINQTSYFEKDNCPEINLYPTTTNPYPSPRTLNDKVGFKVELTQVVLYSSANSPATDESLYDLGFIAHAYNFDGEEIVPDDTTGLPMDEPYIYEVKDPRCNHLSVNWERNSSGGTPGEDNSNFKPNNLGGGFDYEEDVTFESTAVTFSTAFIPNRPFRSLWELGAIHRGEPYRTIDIADIDKEILDQVKIGPLKKTKGKFNLYSNHPAVIEALISNIKADTFYDEADSSEGSIAFAPSSLSSAPSFSRGIFAEVLKYNAGANDREREALIGRTANLLTTRMDKYSILVVAQSLQELKGVTFSQVEKTAINPTTFDGKVFSILATQRLLAHVVRDAWHNEYKIVQMQLLED